MTGRPKSRIAFGSSIRSSGRPKRLLVVGANGYRRHAPSKPDDRPALRTRDVRPTFPGMTALTDNPHRWSSCRSRFRPLQCPRAWRNDEKWTYRPERLQRLQLRGRAKHALSSDEL